MFIPEVYEWGLSVIRFVQQIDNPWVIALMKGISFVGDVPFYLPVLAALFWCSNTSHGFRIACTVLFSTGLNTVLKNVLCISRPFVVDPEVGLDFVSGYSTPSGHAQLSATFWPQAAEYLHHRWLRLMAALLPPVLIGFSRIYLGVHYPSDVLLGWIIGTLLSLGVLLFWDTAATYMVQFPRIVRILLLAVISVCLNYFSGSEIIPSALFFGFSTGYVLLCETASVDGRLGSFMQKSLRIVIGGVILFGVHMMLKILLHCITEQNMLLLVFAQYVLLGFCASFALPHLFLQIGLYGRSRI